MRISAAVFISLLCLAASACTSSPSQRQAPQNAGGLIAGTLLGRNGAASGNPHGLHGIAGQVLLTFSTSSQVVALPPESVSGSGLFRAAVNAGDYKLHADPASASYAGCRTVPALLHVTAGATVKVRIICQLKGIRLVGGH